MGGTRMAAAFIHGFLLAFSLILPLGVQNVFVFNQGALQKRFIHALPVIITASLCDTLLISLAVLGVSLVLLSSFWAKTVILSAGILFLLYMGWSTWNSDPVGNPSQEMDRNFTTRKQIAFAASVSLLNPHAIMDTVGVIGTGSLAYSGMEKLVFALAAILVSWIWFTGLAAAGRMTGRLDQSGLLIRSLNKISALMIWGAAVYLVFSLFQ